MVLRPPREPPKQQYRQRENTFEILGFNKAQENLRDILAQVEGRTKQAERAKELAEIRVEGQQQPQRIGNSRMWMIG